MQCLLLAGRGAVSRSNSRSCCVAVLHAVCAWLPVFCLQPVVEYVGSVIRNVLSDKLEVLYELQRGGDGSCYMFRLDDAFVVDATRRGSASRFINHSCAVRPQTPRTQAKAQIQWRGEKLYF